MNTNNLKFTIKEWDEYDRPREKLLVQGKNALSDAELVAILIGSGSKNESAVSLSKRILASVDHQIHKLGKLSVKQLMQFKGIGEAKAITIVAGLELGRRRKDQETPKEIIVQSSKDALNIFKPLLGDLDHEQFWVLFLNHRNKVLQKKQMSIGGMNGTLVDVRLLFKWALEFGASSLILGHNHPSGSLQPSKDDEKLTDKIKEAGDCLDIKVLDHIIVTEKDYFSFADNALL